eukprot:TRINITY_DN1019_c0_g1_i3.p1 TRINITY_DN1019_c0_g1~~TRINITY_DN1019_c0_g1_i3.p1  ORF type:complete len:348 (-),score=47.59 TRINITY_DN1019_c0_g1_i3:718-1761(-)
MEAVYIPPHRLQDNFVIIPDLADSFKDLYDYHQEVNEELVCCICLDLASINSLLHRDCERIFCKKCIIQCETCPICRVSLSKDALIPPPRLVINMLGMIKLKCKKCFHIFNREHSDDHYRKICEVICNDCGITFTYGDLLTHNCGDIYCPSIDCLANSSDCDMNKHLETCTLYKASVCEEVEDKIKILIDGYLSMKKDRDLYKKMYESNLENTQAVDFLEEEPKDRICQYCGENFTYSGELLCNYHDGERGIVKKRAFNGGRLYDYWTCCGDFANGPYYFKLDPQTSRSSKYITKLKKEVMRGDNKTADLMSWDHTLPDFLKYEHSPLHPPFVIDHSQGCKRRMHKE